MSLSRCFGRTVVSVQVTKCLCENFVTKYAFTVELVAPRPTPKLEHPLSTVRDFFLNIFAATPHIGGRPSIRNLKTRIAVVTGTLVPRTYRLFAM
jgi:hypothetical protein